MRALMGAGNSACTHGINHEPNGILAYSAHTGNLVESTGLHVHPIGPTHGMSEPDAKAPSAMPTACHLAVPRRLAASSKDLSSEHSIGKGIGGTAIKASH